MPHHDPAAVDLPPLVEAHVLQQAAVVGDEQEGAVVRLQCLLDLPAIEQLEQALESYDGALLLVSHDRRLLENVRLDQRWEVDAGRVVVRHV